ncbi:MAG: helix-turn-helix domain-containing protein [Streptosporangiaceae bacterium]|jgi:AraC-like DNA-binding protein
MDRELNTLQAQAYDEPELWRVNLGAAFSDLVPKPLEPAAAPEGTQGPGMLLSQFITAAVDQVSTAGPEMTGKLADASVCLLGCALTGDGDAAADEAGALRGHVMTYIQANLIDPRLSRTTIAAAHNMSPRTLDRLFHGQQWSVSGYIRHERLKGAHRDLENPALMHRSIAALAAHWCFVDAAHFSRVFRESYGYPPSQARPSAS